MLRYTSGMSLQAPGTREVVDQLLASLPELEAVYLFGSGARNELRADSDLDFAVLGTGPLPAARLLEVSRELSLQLDRDTDLVDLQHASSVLKKEIITSGQRLYARDTSLVLDFEARCLTEYGEYRDAVAPLLDAVRKSGRAYAA